MLALEIWVEACRDEGRHVECVAQVFSATLDVGLTTPFTRFSRHGCEARQAGDLLAVMLPTSGHSIRMVAAVTAPMPGIEVRI